MASGDIKLVYGSQVQPTFGVASLASSASLLAGYETAIVDNSTNLNLDFLVSGKITVGTTPTVDTTIEIWTFAQIEDTPAYPDVFDGTASAETITSDGIKNSILKLVAIIDVDSTTSDRTYHFGPHPISAIYGGTVPKWFGFFVTHNTGVALNATAGNHELNLLPVYSNVAA